MKTFVIAEIGCNWRDLDQAKQLIKISKLCGANAVKFQSFGPDFQGNLRKWSLSAYGYIMLKRAAEDNNICFMSTAFDDYGFEMIGGMGLKYGKVPSGELTNANYLNRINDMFDHLFVSTGMASLSEIEKALTILGWPVMRNITLMHCVSGYPPEIEDVNLEAIKTLAVAFKLPVGLSDHTQSLTIPAAAVALGAVAIEKHITIDLDAVDAKASLTPKQFSQMVDNIVEVEKAMGDGIKLCAPSEFGTLNARNRYK